MTDATTTSEITVLPVSPQTKKAQGVVSLNKNFMDAVNLLSKSHLVPALYRGHPENTFVALQISQRLGLDPLTVAQNLYMVNGKPSWSAQFLITVWNQCGRFSPIRYEFSGTEGQLDWGCTAVSTELKLGNEIKGELITMEMAKREGWSGKAGSKWQTMPGQMLRYRSASFLVRAYAPELTCGSYTEDEQCDINKDGRQAGRINGQVESTEITDVTTDGPVESHGETAAQRVGHEAPSGDGPAEQKTEAVETIVSTEAVSIQMVDQGQLAEMLRLVRESGMPTEAWRAALAKFKVDTAKNLTHSQADRIVNWLESMLKKNSMNDDMNAWTNKATEQPQSNDDTPPFAT
jgi:hypothetical protein